jgi:mycoredoxin-dependent peroxiredoxin
MPAEIGDIAPDFTLKDGDGNEVTLSSFRDALNVTIVFFPFSFSGICQAELCSLRDEIASFEHANTQLLAISCDSRHVQRVWSEQQGYKFPVLSDSWPHGAVAQAYGVFNDALGCATRTTFVIDKQGKIAAKFATEELTTPRAMDDYEKALAAL